jgi:DNA polymerase III gamma/tau subunit
MALIFNCPTTALQHAQRTNCANGTACGTCLSCRTLATRNNPDIIFVDGGITKDAAKHAREQIIAPTATAPHTHPYKIFVIENAEHLSERVQNILLKTIEEPPPYAIFIFTAAHNHNFLDTFLSRAQIVSIQLKAQTSSENDLLTEITTADTLTLFDIAKRLSETDKHTLADTLSHLYQAAASHSITAAQAIARAFKMLQQGANTLLTLEIMLLEMRES